MIRTRQYLLVLGDLAACILALALMIVIRFGPHFDPQIVTAHANSFSGVFVLWLVIFFIFNLYDFRSINPTPRTIGLLAMAMAAAVVLGGFAFYVHHGVGIAPRLNLLIVGGLAFILMTAWRRLFYRLASSVRRSVILIGESEEMREFKKAVDANPQFGSVIAFWDMLEERSGKKDLPIPPDLVIAESQSPETLVMLSREFDCEVVTLIEAYQDLFAKIPLSLMTDEYADRILVRPDTYGYHIAKRSMEIVLACLVLIVTSPILLIAAGAKKLEDGGEVILSSHLRVGKNGKVFQLYKIRSMVMHADAAGAAWTEQNDPRITRVGKIIRKLHIDEIPQCWNIIRGDMSLVGPRPEQPKFVRELEAEIPYYLLRHTIKPGFTGWAQIKFRYARSIGDSKEKWEYDLYYLMNRSLLLDIGIVLKTIQIIFTH